jgi:hypothetical protein
MPTEETIQAKIEPRMNAMDLAQTVEFRHLSPKMAKWILTYVQRFLEAGVLDPIAATKASYVCKTDESTRTLGCQLLANPKIILVLNRFFGTTPEQAFLKQVQNAIYNRKLTIAQIRALELQCQVLGLANGFPRSRDINLSELDSQPKHRRGRPRKDASTEAEAPTTRFKVGDLCTQAGKKYRVTSIDAKGHPLTAEEVNL